MIDRRDKNEEKLRKNDEKRIKPDFKAGRDQRTPPKQNRNLSGNHYSGTLPQITDESQKLPLGARQNRGDDRSENSDNFQDASFNKKERDYN